MAELKTPEASRTGGYYSSRTIGSPGSVRSDVYSAGVRYGGSPGIVGGGPRVLNGSSRVISSPHVAHSAVRGTSYTRGYETKEHSGVFWSGTKNPPVYWGVTANRIHDDTPKSYILPTRAISENPIVETRVKGPVIVAKSDRPIGVVTDPKIRVYSAFTAPVKQVHCEYVPPTVRVIQPQDLLSHYPSYKVLETGGCYRKREDYPVRPIAVTRIEPPAIAPSVERRDVFIHEPRFIEGIQPYKAVGCHVIEDRIVTDESGRPICPVAENERIVVDEDEEWRIRHRGPVYSPLRTIDIVHEHYPGTDILAGKAEYTIRHEEYSPAVGDGLTRVFDVSESGGRYYGRCFNSPQKLTYSGQKCVSTSSSSTSSATTDAK